MSGVAYSVVNAFSQDQKAFTGNPAGVIQHAETLSESDKQKIARQLNLVETTFISPSLKSGFDFRFQYFTPAKELPITGHPTVSALWSLKEKGRVRDNSTIAIETAGGPIKASLENGKIWITQRTATFHALNSDMESVSKAFGVAENDIILSPTPEMTDAGLGHIILQLKSTESLEKALMDMEGLQQLCVASGAREAQLFAQNAEGQYYTRNFCPRPGEEDPACGNGNAALGAWLSKHGLLKIGEALPVMQGINVHRPSCILIKRLSDEEGRPQIMIGGAARVMSEGVLYL